MYQEGNLPIIIVVMLFINIHAENLNSSNYDYEYKKLIQSQLHTNTPIQTPHYIYEEKSNIPKSIDQSIDYTWRTAYEVLNIDHKITNNFIMTNSQAKNYELELKNNYLKKIYKNDLNSQQYLTMNIQCTDPVTLSYTPFTFKTKKSYKHKIKLYDFDKNAQRQSLIFTKPNTQCDVQIYEKLKKHKFSFKLIAEESYFSELKSIYKSYEICHIPDTSKLTGPKKFFTTSNYNSLSCPNAIESIKPLEQSFEGINARIESLLGKKLSDEFLEAQNPYAEIDFSNAPKLKAVFISYLVFRSDFFGQLIRRLLEFHAKKAVPIFIMVADSITLEKDQLMLNQLSNTYSNVKVKYFRYQPNAWYSVSEWVKWLHRSLHIKLFITLSDEDDNYNRVIMGGRNIHDGFIYENQPDHSWSSSLVNYGVDESFIHWLDFDVLITSKSFTKTASKHFIRSWQQDYRSYVVRSHNLNTTNDVPISPDYFNSKKPMIRHHMSFPYSDNHALEQLYADMFSSAKKSIKLVTPYFHLTKKLANALNLAVQRGVNIELITRIDLDGDTADIILSDVNKKGINQFLKKITVYEYIKPEVILHSKIVTIDDEFSYIGSVNLNKRSFVHDSENSLMIYDLNFNSYLKTLMKIYKKDCIEVDEKLKVIWWKSIIINILDTAL